MNNPKKETKITEWLTFIFIIKTLFLISTYSTKQQYFGTIIHSHGNIPWYYKQLIMSLPCGTQCGLFTEGDKHLMKASLYIWTKQNLMSFLMLYAKKFSISRYLLKPIEMLLVKKDIIIIEQREDIFKEIKSFSKKASYKNILGMTGYDINRLIITRDSKQNRWLWSFWHFSAKIHILSVMK